MSFPSTDQSSQSAAAVEPSGRKGAAGAFAKRWRRELGVGAALLLVIAAPWILKPRESTTPSRYDRRLVICTPHNDRIRHEFGLAFARQWKSRAGQTVYLDWRVGGTAELATLLRSDYAAAFEFYATHTLGMRWTTAASSFTSDKIKLPAPGIAPDEAQLARKTFLESGVSVGADLFFGGGAVDFVQLAKAGFLVASDSEGKHGVAALFTSHPDWFQDSIIPQAISGEECRDKEHRWVGAALASLGIVYNRDVLRRLGIPNEPAQWADLGDPRLIGQVALSDPNKSGTVTKALEQLIQQQIQLTIDELKKSPAAYKTPQDLEAAGVNLGWERGLQLIQRISANALYFTDSATKIPLEVAQGDAACGMCIDFYGKSFEELVRLPDGRTRVGFVTPLGGSSVSADPIGMLRGAPDPELATAFMEFVLSEDGQELWNYRPGVPGGPEKTALRRLPIRKDLYTPEHRRYMADADAHPFEDAKAFTYHPEWTASLFTAIRFIVRVMCIDVHDEQQRAWQMLVQHHFPERATAVFFDVKLTNYQPAQGLASDLGRKDKAQETKKARELTSAFRAQYEQAYQLAKDGM